MKFNLTDLFNSVGLRGIKLNLGFAEVDFSFKDADKDAAWEMYIELITRVATQELQYGDERTALDSLAKIFPITRNILKERGRTSINFAKVAVIILNQVIRPFTSKWHLKIEQLKEPGIDEEFRQELRAVQENVRKYARLLAKLLDIEDITDIEKTD